MNESVYCVDVDWTIDVLMACACEGAGGGDVLSQTRIVVAPSDTVAVQGMDETVQFECVVNARSVWLFACQSVTLVF